MFQCQDYLDNNPIYGVRVLQKRRSQSSSKEFNPVECEEILKWVVIPNSCLHQKIRKCSVHSGKEAQKGPAWQGIILQELDGALRYVKITSLRIKEKHLQAMILRLAEHF